MSLSLIAFFAGVLTVATPCVLPVLPVVLSGSLLGNERFRPFIIAGSLVLSVFLFTLLLKASTVFIMVPASFWKTVSGLIVLSFGLTLLFPKIWTDLSLRLGFEKSQGLLSSASKVPGTSGLLLLGAALGPVFASCSPTYALILAVILPQNFSQGLFALLFYCLGLFTALLAISYGGRKLISGFSSFAHPEGLFRKALGLLLVLVGLAIMSGVDKTLETKILQSGWIDFTKFEQPLVDAYEDGSTEEKEMAKNLAKDPAKLEEMLKEKMLEESEAVKKTKELLNEYFPAPELVEPKNWINSELLTLKKLQEEGKIVMLDFWTYSCINCIRTIPALRMLHEEYADQGLVIIGVHSPEFAFEKVFENVKDHVEDLGIEYPVFQDNEFKTWRAYNNRYWPAKYVIDRKGMVRYTHFGEGAYDETESVIRYLLSEGKEAESVVDFTDIEEPLEGVETGETYLGTERHVVKGSLSGISPGNFQAVFSSPETVSSKGASYTPPKSLQKNQWWLEGVWAFSDEKITSKNEQTKIGIRYKAAQVNLVMGVSSGPVRASVFLDGKEITFEEMGRSLDEGSLTIDSHQLFYLVEHLDIEEHTLEIRFQGKGIELFAFTFG